jgi:hypothetical protein
MLDANAPQVADAPQIFKATDMKVLKRTAMQTAHRTPHHIMV